MINLTTKECLYIAKALKVKYDISITSVLDGVNFNEFYHTINKPIICTQRTRENILKIIARLNENIDTLLQEGADIFNEEKLFKKLEWKNIVSNLKCALKCTNRKLEKLTGIDRRNFSAWEKGRKNPGYPNCKLIQKLIEDSGLDLTDLTIPPLVTYTYTDNYLNPSPLKVTEEVAEFIGILNGDGTITHCGQIAITGNILEDIGHHTQYITFLSKKLFNKTVKPKKEKGRNVVRSSFADLYLSKQFEQIGLPIGKKINLRIPEIIKKDEMLLPMYLRGLFDTDGTICRRNIRNVRVGYGSFLGEDFTRDVFTAFQILHFDPKFMRGERFRVELTSDYDVIRFYNRIGTCSYSKIARFLYWRLQGECPIDKDYNFFKSELAKLGLEIEKFTLPFYWHTDYLANQQQFSILNDHIQWDTIRLAIEKKIHSADWMKPIAYLKTKFKVNVLSRELQCNYKTLWQWEVGTRIPSNKMAIKIIQFCERNNINLRTLFSEFFLAGISQR